MSYNIKNSEIFHFPLIFSQRIGKRRSTLHLHEYFEKLKGKEVLVLGLGVSTRPLVRLLLHYGISVTGCDKTEREDLEDEVLELEAMGLKLHLGQNYLRDISGDVAFRTPGLHPDTPEICVLREKGCTVTSEMEAFFEVCPCSVIAVTGSDGKTTTTTLISEMLKHAGYKVWVGGNIGTPLLDKAEDMEPTDKVVLELSSFQLMDLKYSPHIAVVTNLAPNHLDVHKDMDEYIEAKTHIFTYQKEGDILVVNKDNDITRDFRSAGKTLFFSRQGEAEVTLRDDKIYLRDEYIMDRQDILLPGIHNVENYMTAIAVVETMVKKEDIVHVARNFGGVEHRIELVRVKDGVRYYNDSIASSPSRTIAGLRSFKEKVILIAGGYDKKLPFEELGEEILSSVKILVATGATGPRIAEATRKASAYVPGLPEIIEIPDFYDAVRKAAELAGEGDVVLLSPAGPAFDRFKNFMVRGKEFKKTVMEL